MMLMLGYFGAISPPKTINHHPHTWCHLVGTCEPVVEISCGMVGGGKKSVWVPPLPSVTRASRVLC